MNHEQLQSLRARFANGETIKALALEAGVSWQKLWGILKGPGSQNQQQPKSQPRRHYQPQPKSSKTAVVLDSDGIHRITFDSVGEAVADSMTDYAQNESNRQFVNERLAQHMSGYDSWAHCFTKEKLLDTIANPPQELVKAVEEMRSTLMDEVCPPVCSRRRIVRNQDFGDELTPESVLVRSLTPWERMSRENQPRRCVTIGVNLTVSCSQRAEHLLWRGAAAAALADILIQRGVNVEIVAFWSIGRISTASSMVVAKYVVKQSDMPLDTGAVAVALAEIAFARLVALYGLGRHIPGKLTKHMGYCERLPQADRTGIDYLAESNVTSRDGAVAWLKEAAARQEAQVLHV